MWVRLVTSLVSFVLKVTVQQSSAGCGQEAPSMRTIFRRLRRNPATFCEVSFRSPHPVEDSRANPIGTVVMQIFDTGTVFKTGSLF